MASFVASDEGDGHRSAVVTCDCEEEFNIDCFLPAGSDFVMCPNCSAEHRFWQDEEEADYHEVCPA